MSKRFTGFRTLFRKGPRPGLQMKGRNGGKGMRSFSVSGRVNKPGVKLASSWYYCVQELIDEYCGGMLEWHTPLRLICQVAPSGGILPANMSGLTAGVWPAGKIWLSGWLPCGGDFIQSGQRQSSGFKPDAFF